VIDQNHPSDPLEAELARLRPLNPSPDLAARIAGRLEAMPPRRRRSFGDRCLLAAMTSGALAACLDLALLASQFLPSRSPAIPQPAVAVHDSPTLGDYQHALASAEFPQSGIPKLK
jgi:hypothetical protein